MRRQVARLTLLFLLFSGFAVATAPVVPPAVARSLTLKEYGQELHRLQKDVAALKDHPEGAVVLHASLPDKYIVSAGTSSFTIDNEIVKKSVGEFTIAFPQRKTDLLGALKTRLDSMEADLDRFSHPESFDTERVELNEVLNRREFRRVAGPTAFEIWKQKIALWIIQLLDRIFSHVPSSGKGSNVLTWILIAIAVAVLAVGLKRMSSRRYVETIREPIPFAPSARHWRSWLNEAHEAAQDGRWRDAIHLAYWAGISNLEEGGAWVPDRARTPREYLRIISPRNPSRSALSALTNKFEVVWYGTQGAAAIDYEEALQQLEALGCR